MRLTEQRIIKAVESSAWFEKDTEVWAHNLKEAYEEEREERDIYRRDREKRERASERRER